MGVKSTYSISREVAQQVILSRVIAMTDEELETTLESLKESEFRNYLIGMPDIEDRSIKNVSEFFSGK